MMTPNSRPDVWTPAVGSPQARALAYVAARSVGPPVDPSLRVTLQFHPDRLHGGTPILQALASAGVYRSQFETGTSNGGLTAHPGGDRWNWESRIFGAAYDAAPPAERPKYGSLNFRRRATGGAPRFGSAHFRLRPDVLVRTTFCYPDSAYEPEDFGVADRMALIPLAEHDGRFDQLDWSIEAHVHGPIRLAFDVEALVLDPCYRGTDTEDLARALPCKIEWHPGFRLSVAELRRHPAYRGPEYVALGAALARDGELTPAMIGEAARAGRHHPQDLKKVWHYLARFGDRSHHLAMPSPRELTDAERDALWARAARAWDITNQHWHPLEAISRPDVMAFRASAFHRAVGADRLRALLARHGVRRVIETRELIELPAREVDLSEADFEYDGAEGYWCDERLEWLVYASHEDSLTLGGAWLIDAVKEIWPDWPSAVWERW